MTPEQMVSKEDNQALHDVKDVVDASEPIKDKTLMSHIKHHPIKKEFY